MSRSEVLRLGPLNVPLPWLLFVLFAVVGYVVIAFWYRRKPEVRKRIGETGSNALLLFFLVWKLSPLLSNPSLLVRSPLSVLYLPGGVLGLAGGALAALLAGLIGMLRTGRELRAPAARGLAVWAFLLAGGFGAAWLLLPEAVPSAAAPRVTLPDMAGTDVELPGSGTVVLNFWATWCPPCRGELPEIASFARSLTHGKVRLYAVNLASTEGSNAATKVRAFLLHSGAKALLPDVLLDADGRAASAYGVSSIPTTVVVRGGRIIAVHPGVVSTGWLRGVTGR